MYRNMYQQSLETEVLTAEPIQLVQLMYRGALDAIAGARRALADGDIATRSCLLSKAMGIINELALSLDHSQQPALCRNLVELYDYMVRRLIDANVKQIEPPMAEVATLLGELSAAWAQGAQQQQEKEVQNVPASVYMADSMGAGQRFSYAY